MAHEPRTLYEATIGMEDGSAASAMVYPQRLIEERGYEDISNFGGWAAYKAAQR